MGQAELLEKKVRANARVKHLLSPGRIGSLELKNRLFVTAMGVSLAEDDGTVGDRLLDYHRAQARGGAALIITGVCGVAWPVGAVQRNQIGISDDRFIPGLTRLTEMVHAEGGLVAAQLHHGGLVAGYSAIDGHPLWAPATPPPFSGDFPSFFLPDEQFGAGLSVPQIKVLEKEDIALAVRQYAEGAARAKKAGFDAVEIHGGHGYLLSSFMSPSTNTRTDEYGGSLENRARLLLDVVRAVRGAVGQDFTVWVKFDSREIGKKVGITIENACEVAPMIEAAGADGLTVSSYHDTGKGKHHSDSNIPHEPGAHIEFTRRIKWSVSIPVISSGRIEMDVGDKAIEAGDFDFLALGRKILADPELPRKLEEQREAEIRPCIYCYTCVSAIYYGDSVRCAVRPETAFEGRNWSPPSTARRIVVIGGGPGGMEAARRLDSAGHEVILLERGVRLGGTLQFAGLAYEPNERLLNWLRRGIEASRVNVRLRTEATPELVASLRPDAVLVATGAVRDMPPIPGSHLDHVLSGDDLRNMMLGEQSAELKRKTGLATRLATRIGGITGATANLELVRKATHAWMPLGKQVAIIGGELVGLELAEFLMERGREVAVIGEAPKFGAGLTLVRRMRLITELAEHGVRMFPASSDIVIEPGAVQFTDGEGASQVVSADHVVVATGAHGDTSLAEALRAKGLDVRVFGDCTGVGYIEGAIRGAAEAVASL